MATVADILQCVETIAPPYMAESWDNVGLFCGRKDKEVKTILVALDPFRNVIQEAIAIGADLILTHHPLIFPQPIKAVTDSTEIGRALLTLIEHGIAAINAHTNLDKAPGGVNDRLAAALNLSDIQVLDPEGTDAQGRPYGLLRTGFAQEQTLDRFLPVVKENLHCQGLRFVDSGKPVRKVAVGGGSCSGAVGEVLAAGCDTFVTADVKYNGFRDAYDLGLNLIDAGHFHTENPVVRYLAECVSAQFPEITVKICESHNDCMKFY